MKEAYVVAVGTALALGACDAKPPDARSPTVSAPASSQGGGPSASSATAEPLPRDDSPVRIWVTATGAIELNGVSADMQQVEAALRAAAPAHRTVFYGREAADQEPHPNAMRVLELIIANRLSVRMSTQHDFSDAVDAEGRSHE